MAELNDYRSAIVERFPELELQTIEYLAHGIDHVACLVNGNLIFRFPKRAEAEAKLLIEMRLLPELAPTLPLPIPNFEYLSPKPSASFPYAFVGYRLLTGEPLTTYIPAIWDETWWARALGEFLMALHSFPLQRAQSLGVPGGTTEWWRNRYLDLYRRVQAHVFPLLTSNQHKAISRYFEDYLNDPRHFDFQPVLLHGDIHSEHILLDMQQYKVTGILDFSACVLGDPAFDIRNAWEPYYNVKQDASWRERRTFYYELQPLLEAVLSSENSGITDVKPQVRAKALEQINQKWPPDSKNARSKILHPQDR